MLTLSHRPPSLNPHRYEIEPVTMRSANERVSHEGALFIVMLGHGFFSGKKGAEMQKCEIINNSEVYRHAQEGK